MKKMSNTQPIEKVQNYIEALEGMRVSQWYRGAAHTLHLEFGDLHQVELKGHLGAVKASQGDYSLFLDGFWKISDPDGGHIESVKNTASEIDAFVEEHDLGVCSDVHFEHDSDIFVLQFDSGIQIDIKPEDDVWFGFEKFNDFSFSPIGNGQVEYEALK